MIEGLKPYAEYKESGSKWLGAVPAKWEVRNLRTLISKRAERDRPDLPLLSVAREKGVFVRSMTDADENHNVIPEDLTNYKVARAGNLVINKMKAWQGSMGIAPCDGIVSPAYFVFDFRIANHAFGQRLLRSKPYVAHFGQASDGVRVGQWDLSIPGMRQIPVLVPSEDEQAAIVRFLDHANRKIDGFIRAKRKLIGLLNEQKQTIIHRAVTRGLHPDVPLKPSGIPWLGDIPIHWEARRVKQATRILRGKFSHRPRNDPSFYDGPYPFIQTGAVAQADKFINSYKQTLNEKGLSVSKLFPSGTLVMTIAANIGDVAILTFEACFPDSIVGFVPASKLDRDYLYFVFRCMKGELLREAPVNTQGNLNVERIGTMWMPLPPLSEQEQITKYIERDTEPLTTAIARTEREIALMQEYRTRLTADLVTGKLDVREAVDKLPASVDDGKVVEPSNELSEETEEEILES
jgi:type I restriction enzyme S subunit